jgi:hypothetical protein
MSLTTDQVAALMRWGQAADNAWYHVATDRDEISYPAPGGGTGTVANQLKRRTGMILDAIATLAADVRASRTAIEAIASAGGDVNTAAILIRMDQLAADDRAREEQLQARIAELEAALAERDQRLAAALTQS